jgi:glutamate-ammonia-ligase adenylyltransferase
VSLADRLAAAVAGTPLAKRLEGVVDGVLARSQELADIDDAGTRDLARLLASNAEVARYLGQRPALLARIVRCDPATLEDPPLEARLPADFEGDLEGFVDGLRLLRRDEMAATAALDLAAAIPFERASLHLSVVAEGILQRALEAARAALPDAARLPFSVVAMGKLAGRELTYHSDLDLVFVYSGETERVHVASRLAQKLIHYLSVPTGAGTAYAIDARLRPSGRKGSLVISYDAYRQYQLEQAQTWEHMALMRSRPVGGDTTPIADLLSEVRDEVCARTESPWSDIAAMRARVHAERGSAPGRVDFKTGEGGTMDVDFLAAGARLECGALKPPELPAVPRLLASVVKGSGIDEVLASYAVLRLLEARVRWVTGRPAEAFDTETPLLGVVAELFEPGLSVAGLFERTQAARGAITRACERVFARDSIRALED